MVDHARLQALISAHGFDGLLVVAPENFAYLVGTPGFPVTIWRRAGPASVVVTADGAMTVIAPDSREAEVRRLNPEAWVLTHPLWMERLALDPASDGTPAEIIAHATAGRDARRAETYDEATVLELVRTAVGDAGLLGKRVGIELEFAPALDVDRIRAALGDTRLVDSSQLIRELRALKTTAEIALHRWATQLTELGIRESLRGLDGATTAVDVQVRYREAIGRAVQQERVPNFEAAGTTVNLGPHLWGAEVNPLRTVQPGDLIQFDSGVVLSRSMSDIGRTFSYGRAGDLARHIQTALLAGFEAGKAELRPGRRFCDVFQAAQEAVRANGIPSYTRGHLGHSIGSLYIEEWPFISATEQRELEPGMIMPSRFPIMPTVSAGFRMRTTCSSPPMVTSRSMRCRWRWWRFERSLQMSVDQVSLTRSTISRRQALKVGSALAGAAALGPRSRAGISAQDATPVPGGTLIIGSIQEPDNLNPWLTATTVGSEVNNFIYEPLTRVDPEGNHIPVLAADVPSPENGGISADLLTYTYALRTDVTWQDGTPFTADDVLFTYNAIADASVNAPGRLNFQYIESVAAPDPQTVVFTLNAPHGAFLETWTTGILPKHIFEGQDMNTTELNRAPSVGTGPYKFVEWRSGDAIIVERNESYWREGAYLDRIEYRIVPNSDTLLANLEAGEIDMRYVMTAEHVPIARELEEYTVHETPAHAYFHFTINQQDPVVGDRLMRQALTYGLDKATITETVLLDLVQPHWSPIAQPSWAYVEPGSKMEFDTARAGQLLDEAGWTGEETRQKDGEPLQISLMSIAGDTERQQVVQLAQAMWAEIGVEVEIEPVDLATFVANSNEGTYQVAYGFWGYGVDPSTYNGRWLSTSESNFLKYNNPEVDQILTQALQIVDREERKALYQQFQEIVIEDATNIYLYNRILFDAVKNRVRGFVPNPGGATNTWNAHEWWVED